MRKALYSFFAILLLIPAENFALTMREIPNVKLFGDFTSGGFADTEWRTLPCGWKVCIPYSLFTDKNWL